MIYFDENKDAYAYIIDSFICKISDTLWEQYYNTDKWDIVDGEFIDISDTKEYKAKKKQERHERLQKYSMTKQDFFNYVLKPNGISISQLMTIINSNEDYQAAWLCNNVYRGNTVLVNAISKFIPALTDDELDNLFEQYGK